MSTPEQRLAEFGIVLPEPAAPLSNYVPSVRIGSLVYISGQVSIDASGGVKGVVGVDVDPATAVKGARLCGINLITQIRLAAGGDLSRLARVVRLGGFIQAGPDFFDIPTVVNGCSDLLAEVFGDTGRHARSAVGVYRLPANFAVEVDAVVELA